MTNHAFGVVEEAEVLAGEKGEKVGGLRVSAPIRERTGRIPKHSTGKTDFCTGRGQRWGADLVGPEISIGLDFLQARLVVRPSRKRKLNDQAQHRQAKSSE